MAKLSKVIEKIDTAIGSYTDETSHEERKKVVNMKTGAAGIIVSENIPNPKDGAGKGFIVQWLGTGGNTWYPQRELDAVNSELKPVSQELTDLFTSVAEINV